MLHAKAKESSDFRFYSLYDKVYRKDVLEFAYRRCRHNGGSAGVDGEGFADIEAYGVERWLEERAEELRNKTYRPQAVLRVWIPKPDGSLRPLGIPTVRDRVIQTVVVLILEPIFEVDLQPEQYAYRSGRSALGAVEAVHGLLSTGHTEVVDADLKGYFDEIPHAELMKSVSRRVSDGQLLHLIKMWLQAPVDEIDDRGRKHRTTPGKDRGRGCPQGAPISPLLANIYMRRFVLGWKVLGHERRLQAKVVNFADDLVICCRGTGEEAMATLRKMMLQLKLPVNEAKTRLVRVPDESVEFLGYTIGRCYSWRTGRAYIGTRPSKQSVKRVCQQISELTGRRWAFIEAEERVSTINRILVGWSNYFCRGPVSGAYGNVDYHTETRLRAWLCRKHKVQGRGTSRFPYKYLYGELGLVRLGARTRNFPWAKA
jgi:group II intron reverse transcriptase/maturase